MARAYSLDLRKRVVEAIKEGLSTREAARRSSIGISTSGTWYREWRSSGRLEPGRQGKPKLSKLDAHEAFILALVDTDERDITLAEIAERLEAERGVRAGVTNNLLAHKVAGVREIIEAAGACLRYLPPYSPDFNPIEMAFAKLKAFLRKVAARSIPELWDAVRLAIDRFEPKECENFFAHAGYDA